MNVETFTPRCAMTPIGPYSHIAKAGPFLWISGTAGVDPETGELAGHDPYSQARQILQTLRALLESVGSSWSQVLLLAAIAFGSGCANAPQPSADRPGTPKGSPVIEDDSVLSRPASPPNQVIAYGPGSDEIADLYFGGERAERRPLVILIHGGFWRPAYDRLHTRPLAQALAAAGWTVATPEYRRVPGDPEATLHDIRVALEEIPAKVAHHNGEVLLIGHSAGGHLVLWAAAAGLRCPLRGVVALAPVADLRLAHERHLGGGAVLAFLGALPEGRPDLDPLRMPEPQVPITVVQGEGDEIVPPEIARSYAAAHPKTRLVRVQGAAHFALIDPESLAWPVVLGELERLAKP